VGVTAGWTANPIAGAVAAAIAAAVVLYDAWGKHQGLFGPINMGICRGLNLLLGIAAAPAALESAWTMAFLPLVYIAAVTAVSRGEVSGGPRGVGAFALISLSGVVMALAALSYSRGPSWIGLALALALSWRVLPAFWAAWQTPAPAPIRHAVRTGVLSLVLLDATIGAAFGGALWSVLILATGLVAASLARVFAVT
jgi:4-hydroxybenzoate polyprenyltransferase